MRAYMVDGLGRSSYIDIEDSAPPAAQEAATVPATAAPQPIKVAAQPIRHTSAIQARTSTGNAITLGLDLSHWQGYPNFTEVKEAGYDFVILKAGEGASSTDGSFDSSARNAAAAGLIVGAYYFARPGNSAGWSQADHFADIINDHGITSAWLDIEVTGGLGRYSLAAWCADFLSRLRVDFAGKVGAYASQSYARDLRSVLFAGDSGAWIADPGYRPGMHYDIWQKSWRDRVPSISGDVDENEFEGDLEAFKSWLGIVDPPIVIPPPVIVPPTPPVITADPVFKDNLITVHTAGFNRIVAAANGADHTTPGARQIVRKVFGALAHLGHGSPNSVMVTDGIVTAESKKFAVLVLKQWQTHLGHPATGELHNSELMAVGSAAPGHLFHAVP